MSFIAGLVKKGFNRRLENDTRAVLSRLLRVTAPYQWHCLRGAPRLWILWPTQGPPP